MPICVVGCRHFFVRSVVESLTLKKHVGLSECDPEGEYPTDLRTLRYGLVVVARRSGILIGSPSEDPNSFPGETFAHSKICYTLNQLAP
jgi:hypothetical protein